MVQQAEKTSGFFESVAESRAANSYKGKKADHVGLDDGKRFQRTLDGIRRDRSENNVADIKTTPKKLVKNTEKNNDVANARASKSQEVEPQVGVLIMENSVALSLPRAFIKNDRAVNDVEIENANSSFATVNWAGIEDLGFDIKMDALENIEAILREVGNVLNLNINPELPMIYYDGEEVPEEVVAHLAQVLMVFKEIANAFLQAGLDGKEVENNGEVFSPKQALQMGQYLQQEVLKLELSFAQLGISQQIAGHAVKINPNIEANTGVHIAADLETRTPAQQILPKNIENILQQPQDLIKTQINELKALMEQMKEMMNDVKAKVETAVSAGSITDKVVSENATKTPVIEALNELKKEIAKDQTPNVSTSSTTGKIDTVEIKSEIKTEVKPEMKIEIAPEMSAKAKAAVKDGGDVKSEVVNPAQVEVKVKKQVKAETITPMSAQDVLKNEFVSPMRDAMVRATEGNIASPIALDGVTIEAQKFNDSGEITAVSPRFAKIFEKEIVEQVQRTIFNTAKNGNGTHEITLTLTPEKLGEIRLTIRVEGNLVSASMNVENSQVKTIVEQNLQQLRDALAKQDLAAGSFDVNVGNNDARDLQERLHNARMQRKNAKGFNAEEGVMTDGMFEFGVDTGRRFGTNSFEFFA